MKTGINADVGGIGARPRARRASFKFVAIRSAWSSGAAPLFSNWAHALMQSA